MGNDYNEEFCTVKELREFQQYGMYIDEDSCLEEIIQNFNETFMQGEFVPSLDKTKAKKEEKSVTELAEELFTLTEKEKQAKQLLEQYEHQLPNKDDKEFGED